MNFFGLERWLWGGWTAWATAQTVRSTILGDLYVLLIRSFAMRFITNQDVGEKADAWLDWWETNRAKSQEEWIADGFANRGFKIDVPPKSDQTCVILALMGSPEAEESAAIPEHMKYNAFRCLRDSGFEPVQFVLANHAIPTDIEGGLLEYAKWQRRWPEAIGLGTLPFANKGGTTEHQYPPTILKPVVKTAACTIIFVSAALGVVLFLWSFRQSKQDIGVS